VADTKDYQWPIGRLGFTGKPSYKENPNALHLLSQDTWEGDRPIRDPATGEAIASTVKFTHAQRVSNYFRRMIPHFLGWFPFVTAIVIKMHHLEYSRWRLESSTDLKIPSFVNLILYGSYLLFTSFAFVQMVFQYLPPGMYWVIFNQNPAFLQCRTLTELLFFCLQSTEICYCILSLTAKAWLGTLMLWFVIGTEMRAADVLGAGGLETA
jgi:hypothetical protein